MSSHTKEAVSDALPAASDREGVALGPDEQMPRDAGPGATRDGPDDDWTLEDEASDESFPASDPPAY